MAIQTKEKLKKYFAKGEYPTEAQFGDLVDSLRHCSEPLKMQDIDGLSGSLNNKMNISEGNIMSKQICDLVEAFKALNKSVSNLNENLTDVETFAGDIRDLEPEGGSLSLNIRSLWEKLTRLIVNVIGVTTPETYNETTFKILIDNLKKELSLIKKQITEISENTDSVSQRFMDYVGEIDPGEGTLVERISTTEKSLVLLEKAFGDPRDLSDGETVTESIRSIQIALQKAITRVLGVDPDTYTGDTLKDSIRTLIEFQELNIGDTDDIDGTIVEELVKIRNRIENRTDFALVWKTFVGAAGSYNPSTGMYSLNEIEDLSYRDALNILSAPRVTFIPDTSPAVYNNPNIRTYITQPQYATKLGSPEIYIQSFAGSSVETLNFDISLFNKSYWHTEPKIMLGFDDNNGTHYPTEAFRQCVRLKKIIGTLHMPSDNGDIDFLDTVFEGCENLREFDIRDLWSDIDLSACRYIYATTLINLMKNAKDIDSRERSKLTLYVHPEIYTKIMNNEIDPVTGVGYVGVRVQANKKGFEIISFE